MVLSAIRLNVAGSPTDWKHSSECKAHQSRAYSPNFWRSNMPCSSASYLFGCDYEKVQKISNSPLESMWHIPIDFKNWGPLSVQRFLSHVPSGRCEVVGAALKLQQCRKRRCMLRWFRSPASCSSAAWLHGGCSMGGASLEGTCGYDNSLQLVFGIFWSYCSLNF